MQRGNRSKPVWLGIDLGGTNIKTGVVDDDGQPLSRVKRKTEADRGPDVGIDNIVQAARQAVDEAGLALDDIAGIGLATPGTMDIPAGCLLDPPNLPGWNDLPIRDRVAERLQRPIVLQNDANAAAWGEYWVGAGRDVGSLMLWTLGTGIGGGIIIEDRIVEGAHSHGSECGHLIIEMTGGRLCGTGQHGTLEAYAGGKALIRRAEEAIGQGRASRLRDWIAAGEPLTPRLIAKAAEADDELANELVMDTAKYLGVGTVTVMHVIDPALVLFGGAMTFGGADTELGRRFLERIRDEVRARAFPIPARKTKIEFAHLGSDAGYIGAAGWVRSRLSQ